jgi:hypothetical protein
MCICLCHLKTLFTFTSTSPSQSRSTSTKLKISSTTLQAEPYVRDPRIIWPDSANVGFDGYIYFNINQLPYQPDWNDGVDRRQHPGLILRSKLPDGAGKNMILGAGGSWTVKV